MPGIPGEWSDRAKCKGQGHLFFTEQYDRASTNQALAICATCPVRTPCAEWAISNSEHGIWGGMGVKALQRARRERGIDRRFLDLSA